jgi:MerR family copper efflux transcriptional regulator
MNIGQASKSSGVSAKMIRYYEAIGLLPEADRRESGYRDYGTADIHRLAFVRRARDLGFSMEQIRALLSLWSDTSRSDAEVRAVASAHVAELEAQAEKLQGMIGTLRHLIGSCRRGDRPHCPIIAELAGGIAESPARRTRKPAAKRH